MQYIQDAQELNQIDSDLTKVYASDSFQVFIIRTTEDGEETRVAAGLAEAISDWEYETDEPVDTSDFVVSSEDADEEDEDDVKRTLYLTSYINQDVIDDLKAIEADEEGSYKISITYGDGLIGKVFDIYNDIVVDIDQGSRGAGLVTEALQVRLIVDVYDVDIVY